MFFTTKNRFWNYLHFQQVNKKLIEMIWKLKINAQQWIIMSYLRIQLQTFNVQQCFDRFHSYLTSTFIQPHEVIFVYNLLCLLPIPSYSTFDYFWYSWLFKMILDQKEIKGATNFYFTLILHVLFPHNNFLIQINFWVILFATCYEKWLE